MLLHIAGAFAIIWSVLFFYFATETPEMNPRISEKEKLFIRKSLEKSEVKSIWCNQILIVIKCFEDHYSEPN